MQRANLDAVYIRLRAMCCAEWGRSPGEFEAACERGEIAVEDVVELFLYRASEPILGGRILPFLFRERERNRAERLAEARLLMFQVRATKDPAERERLAQRLNAINEGR